MHFFFLLKIFLFSITYRKQHNYRAVHILQITHFHNIWLGFYNKIKQNSYEMPLLVGPFPAHHIDLVSLVPSSPLSFIPRPDQYALIATTLN